MAAVQINIGDIDPVTGRFTHKSTTYAVNGYIRDKVVFRQPLRLSFSCANFSTLICAQSESDAALWHLVSKKGSRFVR